MAFAALCQALVQSGVHLTGATLPVVEVAFFRSLFAVVVVVPFLFLKPARPVWRSQNLRGQIIRALSTTISMFFWFYGLSTVPLVEVISLSFTSTIYVTIGAALFLGEKVGPRRWAAVCIGLTGALVILRPGLVPLSLGMLSAMLGSVLWATGLLMTKRLSREDGNLSFVVYAAGCAAIFFAVPTAITWETPGWDLLAVLFGMGIFTAIGHVLMSNALRLADASVAMPIDYTRLVWAAVIGYFFFNEQPELLTLVGAAMIIGASLFIIYRESRG